MRGRGEEGQKACNIFEYFKSKALKCFSFLKKVTSFMSCVFFFLFQNMLHRTEISVNRGFDII